MPWVKKQTGREKNADSLRLPAKLQDELAQLGGGDSSLNRRRDLGPSRKERRKQERKQRKQGQSKQWRASQAEDTAADGPEDRSAGRRSLAPQAQPLKPSASGRGSSASGAPRSDERRERSAPELKRARAAPIASKLVVKRKLPSFLEEDEDANDLHIAMLEKRLGIRKKSATGGSGKDARAEKRLKQELKADGFGFLERFESGGAAKEVKKGAAGELKRGQASTRQKADPSLKAEGGKEAEPKTTALQRLSAAAGECSDDSAGEEWERELSAAAGGAACSEGDESMEDDSDLDVNSDQDLDADLDADASDLDERDVEEGDFDEIGSGDFGEEEFEDGVGSDGGSDGSGASGGSIGGSESGGKGGDSAQKVAVVGKAAVAGEGKRYVPPALRGDGNAEAARSRQLRGLLNRLSESNLATIATQIAELLTSGRQRVMVDLLVGSVLGACISEEQPLASLALLNAAVVRAVALAVGAHVSALFVEALVLRFEEDYTQRKVRGLESTTGLPLPPLPYS
jgi:nucleolar MIF4G domain-containing protein 1